MRQSGRLYLILVGALVLVLAFAMLNTGVGSHPLLAQEGPAAETEEPQPPTATSTATATATPTTTPTATPTTEGAPTATATPTTTPPTQPPAAPVAIPEPITVVLFGTGLAALSAAAAARRKKDGGE